MRAIDTYFRTSPDTPLFHYTGISTLLGLAEQSNRVLWASHIGYMNDSKELLHACEEVMKYIEMPGFIFGGDERRNFLNAFRAWIGQVSKSPPNLFVFSLSEQSNLLSQWRSYTPHGKGISIAFDTELVSRIAALNGLRIGKCIYTMGEQIQLVESLIEKLWISFTPDQHRYTRWEISSFFDQYRNEILQVLALIKHDAFAEEQEWRLISNELCDTNHVFFRAAAGAALLTPYIELQLPAKNPLFGLITLGPTPHEELGIKSLDGFLRKTGLSEGAIPSKMPYREW